MRHVRWMILVCVAVATLGGAVAAQASDALFQVSVINALMEGVYDGEMTIEDLAERGDFGLGTVHALDGEMVAVDGRFFQVPVDGGAYELSPEATTPFATVVFFQPEMAVDIDATLSLDALQEEIARFLSTPNAPYAVRVSGSFAWVRVRSVHEQTKPYPRLAEVTANQVELDFHDVSGTLVGFWTPAYMEGVNVPGFHFHFLSDDASSGGHVLDVETRSVRVEIDQKDEVVIRLPVANEAFATLDFARQSQEELQRIER